MNAKTYALPKKKVLPKNVKPAISEKAFYLIAIAILSKEMKETTSLHILSQVKMAG